MCGLPIPNGLVGWSKTRATPKITSCKDVKYYKIEGVDHFLSKDNTRGTGPISEADCRKNVHGTASVRAFSLNGRSLGAG